MINSDFLCHVYSKYLGIISKNLLMKLLEIKMDALAFILIGKSFKIFLMKLLEIKMDALAFILIGKSLKVPMLQ